jgi:hypothetical protein
MVAADIDYCWCFSTTIYSWLVQHEASCTLKEPEESRTKREVVRMNMESVGGLILVCCIVCCEQTVKELRNGRCRRRHKLLVLPDDNPSWLVHHGASCPLRDTRRSESEGLDTLGLEQVRVIE